MQESPKPFPCQVLGCTLSFNTEDHLSSHARRHDLDKLDMPGKAAVFSDKTPTPTRTVDRLLKNCDAVGLFDDLQNVNPFEETFRKAVENKTGINLNSADAPMKILAEVASSVEDLNTPNCFPSIPKQDSEVAAESKTEKKTEPKVQKPPRVPPRRFLKILPKPPQPSTSITKDKIKLFLIQDSSITETPKISIPGPPRIRVKTSSQLLSSKDKSATRDSSDQRALQNREAAKRYRKSQKMKKDKLMSEIERLRKENETLKRENVHLKKILVKLKERDKPPVKCETARA